MVKAPYSVKYTNAVKGIGKPFIGSIFYKINLSQINYSIQKRGFIYFNDGFIRRISGQNAFEREKYCLKTA